MGTMPIGKLMFSMATPMIISMLVQALYNVVDTIYVSRISENAMSAVSMAFPIQNLLIGFSTGVAVGVNALLSRSLGSREFDRVSHIAGNGLLLAGISTALFMLFGLFFSRSFFSVQTDIEEIVEGGSAYLRICTLFSFGIFGEILFERFLQSSGRTVYTLLTQGVGAILNIIFDPIFIFGYFGVPKMGVAGAAVATVMGQIVAFVLAVLCNRLRNPDVRLTRKGLRPNRQIIRPILTVGIPSIIMVGIGSVMNFGFNQILLGFPVVGATAVAVFGGYFKLQSFIFMPVFGLNNAMVSIVAYNYGARKPQRIMKTILLACTVASSFMLIGLALFQLAPELLLSIFNPSADFLRIGRAALRTISISFLFAGVCIVLGSVFQALGTGIYTTIVSLARQLLVLLPAAYLLSLSGEITSVWWAYPISELASVAVTGAFMLRIYRRKIKPLYQELPIDAPAG